MTYYSSGPRLLPSIGRAQFIREYQISKESQAAEVNTATSIASMGFLLSLLPS